MKPASAGAPEARGATRGRLLLVPNALDLGTELVPLADVLPQAVIATAAHLGHWVVEDARSARAFLKRVDALVPLAQPLQATQIAELPGRPRAGAAMPNRRPRTWHGMPNCSPRCSPATISAC